MKHIIKLIKHWLTSSRQLTELLGLVFLVYLILASAVGQGLKIELGTSSPSDLSELTTGYLPLVWWLMFVGVSVDVVVEFIKWVKSFVAKIEAKRNESTVMVSKTIKRDNLWLEALRWFLSH